MGLFKTCESPCEALCVCASGAQLKVNEMIILMSERLCQCHMKPLSAPPLTFHLAQNLCSRGSVSGEIRQI